MHVCSVERLKQLDPSVGTFFFMFSYFFTTSHIDVGIECPCNNVNYRVATHEKEKSQG